MPEVEKPLTDEEHEARAMLMGMRYHHGNGDPVYYEVDDVGVPIASTMVNANDLTKLVDGHDIPRAFWHKEVYHFALSKRKRHGK